MRSLAVLSLHTSPLAQPGSGDSGGMNVYVRELVAALAQAGVRSEVYVRRWSDELPEVVDVEPGFRVVHVPAGPSDLPKELLPEVVDEFTDRVGEHLRRRGGPDAIHANYWLSGLAGHRLKHELDLPLVSTFHTLARVKAETGDPEPGRRIDAETEVIACSDAILANCAAEVGQLVELYGADPARIEVVPPGVDHAFFSPGDRRGARAALGLGDHPVLLFAGRIQPLKGLTVAVEALAELRRDPPGRGARRRRGAERGLRRGRAGRGRGAPRPPRPGGSGALRAAPAPPPALHLLPRRRRVRGPQPVRVVRAGGPRGGGVRHAGGGRRRRRAADPRRRRRHRPARRHPRRRRLRGRGGRGAGPPGRAEAMGRAAAERARGYTWSTTAARLRRLYADLTSRAPVTCS